MPLPTLWSRLVPVSSRQYKDILNVVRHFLFFMWNICHKKFCVFYLTCPQSTKACFQFWKLALWSFGITNILRPNKFGPVDKTCIFSTTFDPLQLCFFFVYSLSHSPPRTILRQISRDSKFALRPLALGCWPVHSPSCDPYEASQRLIRLRPSRCRHHCVRFPSSEPVLLFRSGQIQQ